MARRAWFLAATVLLAGTLLLVVGCGETLPSTPVEQGAAFVRAGRYDDAIASYTEAIRLSPRDEEAYLYRGRAHHCRNQANDLELAIADFTQAIDIKPKDPEPYYSRSMAYRDHGDAEKSQDDDVTARRLDPRISETYAQLPDVLPPTPPPATNAGGSGDTTSVDTILGGAGSGSKDGDGLSGKSTPSATDDDLLSRRRNVRDLPAANPSGAERNRRARRESADSLDPLDPLGSNSSKSRSTPRSSAGETWDADRRLRADDSDDGVPRQPSPVPRRRPADRRYDDYRSPLEQRYASPPATSPWQPRTSFSGSLDGGNPYQPAPQSPFPQRTPRPTGYVDEPVQGPFRSQSGGTSSNPYSIPTNHPTTAVHGDLNP
jgi:hypothetical protein